MNNAKTLAILFAVLVGLAVSMPAQALPCVKRTTTYWGYYYSDGSSSCLVIIGPPPPPEVVGERIRECDGSISSWGLTSCPDYTVETEECTPCNQQQATGPESQKRRVLETPGACQAEESLTKQQKQ